MSLSLPLLRTRCFSQSFPVLPETESESNSGFPKTFEAPESKEEVCLGKFLDTKRAGLGFATGLQENGKKFMKLNKRRKWHHSSRVKLPVLSKSAGWFLVSTYLIWILGPKLILSNNRSYANLWVLDTCLIIGLLPLMVILIAALLSSKMHHCVFIENSVRLR